MMKTYKFIFLAAIAATTILPSCSDDFLESSPIMSETEATFYKTDDQMFKALMACYDALQKHTQSLSHCVVFGEVCSDNANCGGGSDTDQPDLQAIEKFENTTVNSLSDGEWKDKYAGIYRCNLVINATYNSEVVDVYKAEAKFLRAWYHFELMRYYGPCFISTESIYPQDFKFERNTREEVNAQIIKDLEEAIPVLEESFTGDMVGRIRKSAAQALLGKVYIYQADWDNDNKATFAKAIPQLEAVINSGQYNLLDDYSRLFAAHNENNSESIFEVQHFPGNGEGSYYLNFIGPRQFTNHPDYDGGWGFMLPTQDLYNFYLDDDTARRDAAVFTYDELVTIPNEQGIGVNGKKVTWNIKSYGPDFEGYAQQKYPPFTGYGIVGNRAQGRPANERLIRYGEVYLLLAEAYLRGEGNEAKAREYIQALREKHVPGGYTIDEMMTKLGTTDLIDVLWYERRAELAGEGDRWFDLVRSGRAEKVMTKFLTEGKLEAKIPNFKWEKRMNYLPIGSIEISNSNNSLTAYPDEAK